MRKWRGLIVAGTLTGLVGGLLSFASGRTPSGGEIVTVKNTLSTDPQRTSGDEITVVSWNIHYGGGPTLEVGRGQSRSEVVQYLDAIAAHIREWDADIVALQEVDRGAIRSYDIDQLMWLAEATGLQHAVWTPTWDANWVPHPGLNPLVTSGGVLPTVVLADAVVLLPDSSVAVTVQVSSSPRLYPLLSVVPVPAVASLMSQA